MPSACLCNCPTQSSWRSPRLDRYFCGDDDREVERDGSDADGSGAVRYCIGAVEVDDELGPGVHHGGSFSVHRVGVDVAVDHEPCADPVDVTEGGLEAGEYGEGGESG